MSDLDLCLGRRETPIHGAILLSARDNTPQNKFQRRGTKIHRICLFYYKTVLCNHSVCSSMMNLLSVLNEASTNFESVKKF